MLCWSPQEWAPPLDGEVGARIPHLLHSAAPAACAHNMSLQHCPTWFGATDAQIMDKGLGGALSIASQQCLAAGELGKPFFSGCCVDLVIDCPRFVEHTLEPQGN